VADPAAVTRARALGALECAGSLVRVTEVGLAITARFEELPPLGRVLAASGSQKMQLTLLRELAVLAVSLVHLSADVRASSPGR
jgi:hypothetical protein